MQSITSKLAAYEDELRDLKRSYDAHLDDYEHARRLLREVEDKLHDFIRANARELDVIIETTRENVMEQAA